jgi:hypothetical protein
VDDEGFKAGEPKKVISLVDEDGNSIDFWAIQDEKCERVHIALHCSHSMVQDNVMDALAFFIDEVRDKSIDFLDSSQMVKH